MTMSLIPSLYFLCEINRVPETWYGKEMLLLFTDSVLPPGCFVACCLCFPLHFFNHRALKIGTPLYNPVEM